MSPKERILTLQNVILQPANSRIRLYSGKLFDPLNPNVEDIDIEDIAHALSNLCRFGGHCSEFYSVAQHSVLVSHICMPGDRREGLMHDKTEGSGLVDMVRPIKHAPGMAYYREVEEVLDEALNKKFNLRSNATSVKWADDQLLVSEMRVLAPMSYPFYRTQLLEKGHTELKVVIEPWTPRKAKQIFLDTWEILNKQEPIEISEEDGYPGVTN